MKTSLWPALQKAKLQELLLVTEANMINLEVFFFESYFRHRLVTQGGYDTTSLKNVLIQLSDALKALGTKKSDEQIVCLFWEHNPGVPKPQTGTWRSILLAW